MASDAAKAMAQINAIDAGYKEWAPDDFGGCVHDRLVCQHDVADALRRWTYEAFLAGYRKAQDSGGAAMTSGRDIQEQ